MNFLSQARMEEIGREAWPLYIHTIDSYENKGWPQNIITGSKMDERGYALHRLADDILSLCDLKDPYFNCILQI